MTGRSTVRVLGGLAAITLLVRIVGFARWFVFSHSVGATCVGSVYQSVNTVPNVLFEVAAGGVLAAVVVPIVAGFLGEQRTGEADRTASALLTWTTLLLTPLAVLVVALAQPISAALLGGQLCPGQESMAVDMLRVFAIQIPLYGIGIVLAGVLQAHERFLWPALVPLLSSLVVIAAYLWFGRSASIPVLSIGTTLGVVALSLPLLVPALRVARLRPTLALPEGVGARVRSLALAGILALLGQQVATVLVLRLANARGGSGVVPLQNYVQAMLQLPYAVLAVPVATAAFPALARSGAAARLADAARQVALASTLGCALVVATAPATASFFASIDAADSGTTHALIRGGMPTALLVSAPGIIGLSAVALLTRAAYVRGRARLAGLLTGAGWVLGVGLSWLLTTWWTSPSGVLAAIGVGWSVGLLLAAAALLVLTGRAWGATALAGLGRRALVTLPATVAAGLVGWWAASALVAREPGAVGSALAAAAAAVAGLAAYLLVLLLLERSALAQLRRVVAARAGGGS